MFLESTTVEGVGDMMVAHKGLSNELKAKKIMKWEEIELEKKIGISAIFKKIKNSVNQLQSNS